MPKLVHSSGYIRVKIRFLEINIFFSSEEKKEGFFQSNFQKGLFRGKFSQLSLIAGKTVFGLLVIVFF